MYYEGIEPFLTNLEDKSVGVAGGSVVAMVLSSLNSLIMYISNLTIGKKKYADVEEQVKEIFNEANRLKTKTLQMIDGDKLVLDVILEAYKTRTENPDKYNQACKKGVEFCMDVLQTAVQVLELADRISACGNRMLSSDFQICAHYGLASVESAIVNVKINLIEELGNEYIDEINEKCEDCREKAKELSKHIIENSK